MSKSHLSSSFHLYLSFLLTLTLFSSSMMCLPLPLFPSGVSWPPGPFQFQFDAWATQQPAHMQHQTPITLHTQYNLALHNHSSTSDHHHHPPPHSSSLYHTSSLAPSNSQQQQPHHSKLESTCDTLSPADPSIPTPASVCYNVISYPILNVASQNICLKYINSQVGSLPSMWALFSNACRDAIARLTCVTTHPICATSLISPCPSLCQAVHQQCASDPYYGAVLTQNGFDLNCSNSQVYAAQGQCNNGTQIIDVTNDQAIDPSRNTVQPSIARCVNYTGTVCKGLVSEVYIPAGLSLEDMEGFSARRFEWMFRLVVYNTPCVKHLANYFCSQVFQPCATSSPLPGRSIVLPRLLCKSRCNEYNAQCSFMFNTMPAQANCSSIGTLIGGVTDCNGVLVKPPSLEDYPSVSTTFSPGVTSSCNNFNGLTELLTPQITCPAPLVVPNNPLTASRILYTSCAVPCPILSFTQHEYDMQDSLTITIGIVSLIASTFTLFNWLIDRKKRKQIYIVYFIAWTVFISFLVCVQCFIYWANDLKHITSQNCASNTEVIDVDNRKTSTLSESVFFISFCFTYATISSCCWWAINCVELFSKVVLNFHPSPHSRADRIKQVIAHGVGFGVPVVTTTMCTVLGNVGSSGMSVSFSVIHSTNDFNQDWWTFYYIVIVSCLIGLSCIVATVVQLFISSRKLSTKSSKSCKRYARSIMFATIFLAIFVIIFSFRGYSQREYDSWTASAGEWINCLLIDKPQQHASGSIDFACAADAIGKPIKHPDVALWFLFHLSVGALGSVSFFIYGTFLEFFTCSTSSSDVTQMTMESSTVTQTAPLPMNRKASFYQKPRTSTVLVTPKNTQTIQNSSKQTNTSVEMVSKENGGDEESEA